MDNEGRNQEAIINSLFPDRDLAVNPRLGVRAIISISRPFPDLLWTERRRFVTCATRFILVNCSISFRLYRLFLVLQVVGVERSSAVEEGRYLLVQDRYFYLFNRYVGQLCDVFYGGKTGAVLCQRVPTVGNFVVFVGSNRFLRGLRLTLFSDEVLRVVVLIFYPSDARGGLRIVSNDLVGGNFREALFVFVVPPRRWLEKVVDLALVNGFRRCRVFGTRD